MDKIVVKELEVFANHGVLDAEKTLGQKFLVSLELGLEIAEAALSDDLEKTADYADVCDFVAHLMKQGSYNLIETCAEKIASGILGKYSIVSEVRVTIEKPHAPIMHGLGCVAVVLSRKKETCYIALGSNLGEREKTLSRAIAEMSNWQGFWLKKQSSFHETKPVSHIPQGNYLNAVICAQTTFPPKILMEKLLDLETGLGRQRPGIPMGPRTIDLDLLFYGDLISDDLFVTLPHPRLHERLFVLEPFCEINPMFLHPVQRKRILELRNGL